MRHSSNAAICLILAFCLQALLAAPRLSATSDEPVHLAAGYSYWQTRDFRMNPEHPPLAKLIAALPLIVMRTPLDTTSEVWETANEYRFGFDFLYRNNFDRLLLWSRAMMIALAALGAAITFLWARDLFGDKAALVALAMYSFSPNLLAHGMLVTTDVPVTVFSLLTLYLFWRQGDQASWRSSLAVGLALGAAMASKYSAGLLPLLIVALTIVRAMRQRDRKQALTVEARNLIIVAAASLFVIEASYLFAVSPLTYFENAQTVNSNHSPTYQYYLLGQLKQDGWWYYFLAAFAFKATLATLIFMALAAVRTLAGLMDRWAEIMLLTTIAFFVVIMSAGANDIGIRYLLPTFPLIFIWISRIVPDYWTHRVGRSFVVILVTWQIVAAVSAFPNYIPYFNELAGGTPAGPDILDDSNVDWGQGLKQAGAYVKEKGITDVAVCSFSPFDNPQAYGLPRNLLGPEMMNRVMFKEPPPGTYIISAHYLARMKVLDPAWRSYRPVDRIAGSLWVYRF